MRLTKAEGSRLAGATLVGLVILVPAIGRGQTDSTEKRAMVELGLQHETAWELYQALEQQTRGDERLSWDRVPDWTGIYTREFDLLFDTDQSPDQLTTAKLTPEYEAMLREKIRLADQGVEYDSISDCSPPGYPRWLHVPFLREFVITPHQTLLISEVVNSIRRIYTDGRGHIPEEDRYPLYYGDSIGFWDGEKLVIHTNQLRAGAYTRRNPDHSDQVETVEIWEKVDGRTIEARVWVYDPPSLVEPWYVKQTYAKLTNEDHSLRIRYWHCGENPNNLIIQTEEGASDFADFTFD